MKIMIIKTTKVSGSLIFSTPNYWYLVTYWEGKTGLMGKGEQNKLDNMAIAHALQHNWITSKSKFIPNFALFGPM